MSNLSDIFEEHKKNIVDFIDGVRKSAYEQGRADLLKEFKENGAYDVIRADERERIIEDLEIHAKYCLEVDQSIGDYITVKNCIQIVRGGESD